MLEIIVRYIHFVGIILFSATLFAEHLLLTPVIEKKTLSKLLVIDAIYGASAVVILFAGLTLWFGVGKPAAFYNANWIFHTKVTLFILIALLSIYPTTFFMRHRKSTQPYIQVPKSLILLLRAELTLLLILPLLAVLMSRGVGMIH